jgi:peptidoglycan/LPS O-acetylase OafA/YrhL
MSVEHRNYHTIDGIRGAAAVVVLVFHSSKFLGLPSAEGSYLAVDLFFALSGFILTHAYGRKFDEGLGLAEFMKIRWIRLYPLYFLSGVLGAIKLYRFYNPHGAASALAVTAGSLLGFPNTLPMRDADLYLTNVPAWSLLLEVCANLLLVAIWKKLSNPLLALLIIVGFAGLVFTVWRYGTLNVGFRWPGLADGGGSRVLFSFFAGVAIYRAVLRSPY